MSRSRGRLQDPVARAATAPLVAEALRAMLETVSKREAMIVSLFFGLEDGRPRSFDEIGLMYGVTDSRIEQILRKALSTVRHPSRSRGLLYLDDDGLPTAVMAFLRGEVKEQRPLLHCHRHGWIDPDAVPPANYWWELTVLPRFCSMCPCPLSTATGGRPANYCDSNCRQAAHRFRQKHPRLALTPIQVDTAARLLDEGGDIKCIARSMGVSQSTVRRYLAKVPERTTG